MRFPRLAIPFAFFVTGLSSAQQPDRFYLHPDDKVIFYGDSITDQRLYTAIVETFVATRYPSLHVSFINSGWGGDAVSGGGGGTIDTRLSRDVLAFKPTVVTVMLGMNDGGYHAATAASDEKYTAGYRHIIETLQKELPGVRITAIKPSPYDNVTRTYAAGGLGNFEYNEVMRGYGMWIDNYAKTAHFDVADGNAGIVSMLRRAYEVDPEASKTIVNDRVHPGFAGHIVLASELLKAWNARSQVSEVIVDASKAQPKLSSEEHSHVTELKGGASIRWTALDDALPLPVAQWQDMWGGGPVALVLKSSDVTRELNQQTLKVTGLHPGMYSLKIDEAVIGSFNADQLAQGINMALLKTPASDQAYKVYQLVSSQEEIHYDWWRNIEVPYTDDKVAETSDAIHALQKLEGALEDKVHKTAQPIAHNFELTPIP
jgi:lysophospholipase L1-like esterase